MIFEDVFPSTGDLDMNDIVFDFQIIYKLDNKGGGTGERVHTIEINVKPRAMGGNAYPVIGLAANLLTRDEFVIKKDGITHSNPSITKGEGLFNVNDIGTEIEVSTVIPLCNNLYDCFEGRKGIINTYKKAEKVEASSFSVTIEFQNKGNGFPLYSDLNLVKDGNYLLDLFIVLGERGREIHRKGCPPTNLFDKEYLSDKSNNNNFSSRKDNYVWALIIDGTFKYPIERKAIYEAYPKFSDWVLGTFGEDWNTADQNGDYLY